MPSRFVDAVVAGALVCRNRGSHFCAMDLFGGRSHTAATGVGRVWHCANSLRPIRHSHLVLADSVRLAHLTFDKHSRIGLRVHADRASLYVASHGRSERADLEQSAITGRWSGMAWA